MRKYLLIGAALFAIAAPALGQVQSQISGNEVVRAAQGPGGSDSWLSIQSIRNSREIDLITGTGAATTTMTVLQSTLMWTGAAPTTWAVTLPPSPVDGSIVTLGTATTLTTMVTVTAAAGTTLNATYASQTLTAATSVQWQYNNSNTTWYRLR